MFNDGREYQRGVDIEVRKKNGMFYTPVEIADELSDIIINELPSGSFSILDPSCGSGNLILSLYNKLASRDRKDGNESLKYSTMIDIDNNALNILRKNIESSRGIPSTLTPEIINVDPLRGYNLEKQYDVIFMNPPFGGTTKGKDTTERKELAKKFPLGVHKKYDMSDLFVDLAIQAVKEDGLVAMILPTAFLGRSSAEKLRRKLFEDFSVLVVKELDKGSFENVGISISFILARNDGKKEHRYDHEILSSSSWGALYDTEGDLFEGEELVPLSDYISVASGSTIDEAYQYAEIMVDEEFSSDYKFITSGSIGVGECLWGSKVTTYLKKKYQYPRISIDTMIPFRQNIAKTPKILISGLSNRLKAYADKDATCVPAVSVVVVIPKRDVSMERLESIMNHELLTRAYLKEYRVLMYGYSFSVNAKRLERVKVPLKWFNEEIPLD